jgi:beta-phosphoglucomutase family hydrolase
MDGYLFDLDGVLAPTALLHMRAWERLFTEFIGKREPYTDADYYQHLDGKPRYDGVAAFLASRDIDLPWGDPGDSPDAATVCGLGNRKDGYFNAALDASQLHPYPETLGVLRALRDRGARLAVVTSSGNAGQVLNRVGLADWFEVIVDGTYRQAHELAGKPAPDTFLAAAGLLGLAAGQCAVVEDATSGVIAGKAGGFGLVVGVDRNDRAQELAAAGADLVIDSLEGLL